jgi:hypothetical protein
VRKSETQTICDPDPVVELRARIARQIAANIKNPGDQATSVPGLILYRKVKPIECGSGQYEPSLNIFVQGRKRINVAGLPYLCDESSFLLTLDSSLQQFCGNEEFSGKAGHLTIFTFGRFQHSRRSCKRGGNLRFSELRPATLRTRQNVICIVRHGIA